MLLGRTGRMPVPREEDMKRFLVKLALFVAVQAVIGGVLLSYAEEDTDHYLASTIEKHQRLEAPSDRPRVIFVGGSSMAFGMDGATVERILPDYKSVNMGLHAKVGAPFMLWEISDDLREGDVVVLGLEYAQYEQDLSSYFILRMINFYPRNIRYVPWKQVPDVALSYIGHLVRLGRRGVFGRLPKADPVYVRSGFNEYGDLIAHHSQRGGRARPAGEGPVRKRKAAVLMQGQQRPEKYTEKMMERLAEFHQRCQDKGVRVFIVWPPVSQMDLDANRTLIDDLIVTLKSDQTIPIIQTPDEAVYEQRMFFDDFYHLNKDGALLRAEDIARRLREVLDGEREFHYFQF